MSEKLESTALISKDADLVFIGGPLDGKTVKWGDEPRGMMTIAVNPATGEEHVYRYEFDGHGSARDVTTLRAVYEGVRA